MKFFKNYIFFFGLLIFFAHPFFAIQESDTESFLSGFQSRVWTVNNGLPSNAITAMIQDSSGYIYIGTYEGLVRFDGVEFLVINRAFDPKYNFSTVRALMEDSKGNLWVGTNDEGLAKIAKDLSVEMFTVDQGLVNNSVRAIEEDADGNIWIGTAGGISFLNTTTKEITQPIGLEPYGDEKLLVATLYCDNAGRMWVAGPKQNSIYYYAEGKFRRYEGIRSIQNPEVTVVMQDSRGAFWYGVSPHYAVKIDSGVETLYDVAKPGQQGTMVNTIVQDKTGNMWFAMDGGASVMHSGVLSYYDKEMGLTDTDVTKVMEDTEGNIWFATDRGGVEKLSLTKFRTVPIPTAINAIVQDQKRGVTWLGSDTGLLCYDNSMHSVTNEITEYCKNVRIRHVALTKDNALLVSTYEKYGQLKFDMDGTVTSWNISNGLSNMKTRVAIEADNGDIYVGTTSGLNIIDPKTNSIKVLTRNDGLPYDYIMAITQDWEGTIWVGTDGGGIFTLKSGQVDKIYTVKDGLAGNVIFKILELMPGELYFCTGTGITRFKDGKMFNYNSSNGLGTDSIFQMLVDYTDKVWMTSNRGISYVKLNSMEELAEGKISRMNAKFFSLSDGIRSDGVTSTALSATDSLGRIWFTLIDGVAIYDPVKATANKKSPQVKIESITIDNETLQLNGKPIIIPPSAKRLGIKFTGLSFSSSEQMLFKYKLEGFDKDYSEWSFSRNVSYTNLKPGKYSFTVIALSNEDIESEKCEPLSIIKKPFFWQLWYFWFSVAVFIIAITALLIMRHMKQLKEYQIILEREVARQTEEIMQKAKALASEKEKSERLLLNILPQTVAKELTEKPDEVIANKYDNVSVLFADIVGFTKFSSGKTADEVVQMLNGIFTVFDIRAKAMGIEKIKTIGDAYMAATGLNEGSDRKENLARMISYARGILSDIQEYNEKNGTTLQIRVGINSGSLIAGVIGKTKFIYDIWGDTVNVASRMESTGIPCKIHVTEQTYEIIGKEIEFEGPVELEIKGKGTMKTYFLK